jgi:dUTP pyrophosphatase
VLAGVIDQDYRGEIMVLLHNTDANTPAVIRHGDRVAQLILESYVAVDVVEVEEELPPTVRDTGKFGSTGAEQPTRRLELHPM